ncbi:MAG: hypothetical protein E7527_06150 [Ruminococcaceae bacterium]|nr:hypothetical protein [Oscillospiraceae bacterium]
MGGEMMAVDELELERRITALEDRAKANTRRLDKLEKVQKTLTELVQSVATIAQKQVDMDSDMKEVKADVKLLAGKPARRWDAVAEKVLLTLTAALVGYVLWRVGLSVT